MKFNFSYFFLLLFFSIGFLPGFGSIDRIASQYVALDIINIISFIYFLIFNPKENIKKIYYCKPIILFVILFCWASLSITYSINKIETILNLIRLATIVFSFLNIFLHIFELRNLKHFYLFIFIPITLLEIFIPFIAFLDIVKYEGFFDFTKSGLLETFTPNKNITAAIIACHIPFIFTANKYFKSFNWIKYIFVVIAIIDIILLSSRATILGLVVSLALLYSLYLYNNLRPLKHLHYFSLSFILAALILQLFLGSDNSIAVNNRMTTINTEDASTSQRLRFYKHGVNHILNNPLIGVGFGTWKLKSIEYDKEFIISYIVPYHLHNDFLQYGAELGIIGMILYALIFLIILITNIKRLKINLFLSSSLIMAITILFVDSNFNFPYHRPIMMIFMGFLIALTHYNKEHELE